jgi:plastocyanin
MTTAVRSRRRRQTIAIVLAAGVYAMALIGISGGAASADESARASRTATVTIPAFKFQPATVTVPRGSKVRFSNTSGTAHTATRKGSFNTGRIKPGSSATVQFGGRGTFAYHCSIHPFMKGKVVVN